MRHHCHSLSNFSSLSYPFLHFPLFFPTSPSLLSLSLFFPFASFYTHISPSACLSSTLTGIDLCTHHWAPVPLSRPRHLTDYFRDTRSFSRASPFSKFSIVSLFFSFPFSVFCSQQLYVQLSKLDICKFVVGVDPRRRRRRHRKLLFFRGFPFSFSFLQKVSRNIDDGVASKVQLIFFWRGEFEVIVVVWQGIFAGWFRLIALIGCTSIHFKEVLFKIIREKISCKICVIHSVFSTIWYLGWFTFISWNYEYSMLHFGFTINLNYKTKISKVEYSL